ncbi:MAG: putative Fe-S cluster assembly protein SufT [Gammaproteobacteria bacterium]|jgi:probable FeS assembly SUF system protein SufT|nr:putative Fe-S cluster assembly protein SufT [Gammaproteobacteria bacterium]
MFNHTSQPVKFERDCDVVMIPSGDAVSIPAGTVGYITQALGGSYTVFIEGNLFRIAGADGDAIGRDIVPPPSLPDNASRDDVEKLVWHQLGNVYDPEIPIDIVELGLVYKCELQALNDGNYNIEIEMTLTAPGCGMGDILVDDVRSKLVIIPTIASANIELVFDPPWNMQMMSEAARLETGML